VVERAPETYQQAVDGLLAACPELVPAWAELAESMQSEDALEVGIYNVLGQVVLPAVAYLLGEEGNAALPIRDPAFADLPDIGTRQASDLVVRIYKELDRWASSSDESLRGAVWIEFVEAGYGSLTVEDLTAHAGPIIQSWVLEAGKPPSFEDRLKARRFNRWLHRKYGGPALCPNCGSRFITTPVSRTLDGITHYEHVCLTCWHRWTIEDRSAKDDDA